VCKLGLTAPARHLFFIVLILQMFLFDYIGVENAFLFGWGKIYNSHFNQERERERES
jgi:hypothetical protein